MDEQWAPNIVWYGAYCTLHTQTDIATIAWHDTKERERGRDQIRTIKAQYKKNALFYAFISRLNKMNRKIEVFVVSILKSFIAL